MRRSPVTLLIAALLSSSLVIPVAAVAADESVPDLLPGVDLVTEEFEPGVYRVVSDGVRGLTRLVRQDVRSDRPYDTAENLGTSNIVAGLDGSVWSFRPDGFFRLGDEIVHARDGEWDPDWLDDVEVGPDGTIWRAAFRQEPNSLRSYDGDGWTVRWEGPAAADIEVQTDGSVWLATEDERGEWGVDRLQDDGWQPVGSRLSGHPSALMEPLALAADPEGDVWWLHEDLLRFDGRGWRAVELPLDRPGPGSGLRARSEWGFSMVRADVGPDGTLWVRLTDRSSDTSWPAGTANLARFDGTDWERYDASDGVPPMGDHFNGFWGVFEVAPDGSVWLNPLAEAESYPADKCDGIARFDGEAVTSYLRDLCIWDMDIAPDGAVWLLAGPFDDPPSETMDVIGTYVITPDAVAE